MDTGGMMEEYEQYEEEISKPNRRRKKDKEVKRMQISGRSVFALQEVIEKRAERIIEKEKGRERR